jgi:hypothetical protein
MMMLILLLLLMLLLLLFVVVVEEEHVREMRQTGDGIRSIVLEHVSSNKADSSVYIAWRALAF